MLQPRKGWVPGGIGKSVTKLMTYKCPRSGQEKDRKKKKRKPGQGGQTGGGDSEPEEPVEPKPALKVQRKGDVFIIEVSYIGVNRLLLLLYTALKNGHL